MQKTILITGSTDGIGFETAKMLAQKGHHLLLHGRSPDKLKATKQTISELAADGNVETYIADLSNMENVKKLAQSISEKHKTIDALINNAGVLKAANTTTPDGLDIRFAVNTMAPYLLTQHLLPLINSNGRVINLSSAAQSEVDIDALAGKKNGLADMEAYAQSKLAITMWSRHMAHTLGDNGPVVIAVNPGSLLASKMVKEGFGIAGNDISIGANILVRAALDDEFAEHSGDYFDNDKGQFAPPHPDALDSNKCQQVVDIVEKFLKI